MRLGELAEVLSIGEALPAAAQEREITSVVQDSRQVVPGSLFVAVRGFHSDGHRFVPQALQLGAAAVIVESSAAVEGAGSTIVIRVADTRKALAAAAAKFYGYPSRRLKLVGITGTKGKTTTSYLVRSIIQAAGHRTGLIGTIDYRIGDRVIPAPNTTPESVDLQALLAEMVGEGAAYCVMEVSSHALALGRTDGCTFEAAAFTNLAPEHLDFHGSMDGYFSAKLLLFTGLARGKAAVVNLDDPRGREIIEGTAGRVITYGSSDRADIRPASAIDQAISGLRFRLATPLGDMDIESSLAGAYNVSNILAAVGIGIALGFSRDDICQGIKAMTAVPGRMEQVDEGQLFGVVVDYAHTEGSLIALLQAVRAMTTRRVITLFGCGGDRDRSKRPRMGAAALAGSDVVIVTSDNPRTEDELAIISEIESGMSSRGQRVALPGTAVPEGKRPYLVVPDRGDAVKTAIDLAEAGDIVVLAGKGHEDYQIVGAAKHHFDDREEARRAVRNRLSARPDLREP
ncbi:MAG: UDP-N-acetylmuramoyl-L-alanyl-D-glutamate--2,6-diaminopimelate ligase [Nitrospirota bacterium]|nr:UDP-N-acetylmuramoyl-L-alanyl-D-glutamate--2,6-diaminopimelate ligase [Nitrospirota bacterium]